MVKRGRLRGRREKRTDRRKRRRGHGGGVEVVATTDHAVAVEVARDAHAPGVRAEGNGHWFIVEVNIRRLEPCQSHENGS